MREILVLLVKHGYAVLGIIAFMEAVGLPMPAAIALVAAGAAVASHILRPEKVFLTALIPILVGDSLLYILGRSTGWRLLAFLCRIALNPESCIQRSAESFYRRGKMTLVFAKFIPGINTLSPPLAGSMKMGYGQFLRLDFLGACLYVLTYSSLGFLFRDVIEAVAKGARSAGHALEAVFVAALVGYVAYRAYIYWGHREYRVAPRIQVEELAHRLGSDEPSAFLVADVRSHGYYDSGAMRIKGSVRLEPNQLLNSVKNLPKDRLIFLYCT